VQVDGSGLVEKARAVEAVLREQIGEREPERRCGIDLPEQVRVM
jgi:hypothetical protein